jgi:UDP-3-O-acyl N-acetylglucosamine deacetylase
VKRLHFRNQRTIAGVAEVRGVGYLTGANVTLRFVPAPANTGVVFVRTDLKPAVEIPARADLVTGTCRRTTLGYLPRSVTLVEHVLAALAGLRIDNCVVEVNALEPPGLDGSAGPFARALQAAGQTVQPVPKPVWAVDRPVIVRQKGATLAIYPPRQQEFRVSYCLDYGLKSPIGLQRHSETITPASFRARLAECRTYLTEAEALEMRRQGIGLRTCVNDLLVFGPRGPIDNRLRFANEPCRHKILDILGDLSLTGHDIRGHVLGYRSGHPLNVELARQLVYQIEGGKVSRLAA